MTTDLYRFGSSAMDYDEHIEFLLEPNAVAPAGVGGECLFRNIWIVVTYNAVFELTFTPILDGKPLTNEAHTWIVTATRDEPVTEKFEIGLGKTHPSYADQKTRYGQRGSWFSFRLEGRDLAQLCGIVEVEGVEIEYETLREGMPHYRQFASDALADARRFPDVRFMFGGDGSEGPLYQWGESEDDAGVAIDLFAQPNKIAPAGIGGETMFTRLFFVVSHDNRGDYDFTLVPILDNTELPGLQVTVPGVQQPVVGRVIEVGLSLEHNGVQTYGVRGTWFTFRLQGNGTVPDADIIVEGVDVEYEMLREAEQAINVAPDLITDPSSVTTQVGLDAKLHALDNLRSADLDAIIAIPTRSQTVSLDAIVAAQAQLRTALLDAAIKQRQITVSTGLDADLAKVTTKTASLDAILKQIAITGTVTIDAVLSVDGGFTAQETVALDAAIADLAQTQAASLNAALAKLGQVKTASLDAILNASPALMVGLDARIIADTGADFPNEPAGMTKRLEFKADAGSNPADGEYFTAAAAPTGTWRHFTGSDKWQPVVDAGGLISPSDAYEGVYPNGHPSGVGNGTWTGVGGGGTIYDEIYFCMVIKLRGPSGSEGDWEMNPVGLKLGFLNYGKGNRSEGIPFLENGRGTLAPYSDFNIQFRQNVAYPNLSQNVGTLDWRAFKVNQWHKLEWYLKLNSGPDIEDGIVKCWVDSEPYMDHRDVPLLRLGDETPFEDFYKFSMTFGGTGPSKTRDDYVLIDHFYMSCNWPGGGIETTSLDAIVKAAGATQTVGLDARIDTTAPKTKLVSLDAVLSDGLVFEQDFSTYTSTSNLVGHADFNGECNASFQGTPIIVLDQTQGYGSLTQSMRYDWPNTAGTYFEDYDCGRVGAADGKDLEVYLSQAFPDSGESDWWLEVWLKFNSAWDIFGPASGQADYKTFFVEGSLGSRWQVKFGPCCADSNFGGTIYQLPRISMGVPGTEAAWDPGFNTNKWVCFVPGHIPGVPDGRVYNDIWTGVRWHLTTTGFFEGWLNNHDIPTNGPDGWEQVFSGVVPEYNGSRPTNIRYGANRNQGSHGNDQNWWGRCRVWNVDPGW
jgi:hypothetical protein